MESNGRLEDSLKGPNGIQVALGEQFERANEVQVAPKLAPSAPKMRRNGPAESKRDPILVLDRPQSSRKKSTTDLVAKHLRHLDRE